MYFPNVLQKGLQLVVSGQGKTPPRFYRKVFWTFGRNGFIKHFDEQWPWLVHVSPIEILVF